jgi:hypothetical protein
MTKKHFIAMAARLAKMECADCRREAAEAFADIAAQANASFDRARFLAACGLTNV